MTIDYRDIGERIRFYRTKNNLTQEGLAELTDLSSVYISNIETADRVPSVETLISIANALNTTADDLLSGNLLVSESLRENDPLGFLYDCSAEETAIILRIMNALKDTLRGYSITK